MKRKIVLPLIIIFLWEVGVYFFSADVSDLETIKYQLAARYSARTSFAIFGGLLLLTGIYGLKRIYSQEGHRSLFVIFVLMFTFNHFLHFIFIVLNYQAQGLNLWEGRNFLGALGYVLLLLAPAYLWTKKVLSKSLRLQICLFLLLIVIIFFVTYLGRFSKELPMMSSLWVYEIFLALLGVLVILNVYRFLKDNQKVFL